jgi:predicted membrane metal-binding protein
MDAHKVRVRTIQWALLAAALLLFSTAIATALVATAVFMIFPHWLNEPHLSILFSLVLILVAAGLWRPLRAPRAPHN